MSLVFFVIASYKCFKFHLISLHSFRDILQTSKNVLKSNKGDINKTGKPELTVFCISFCLHMPHIPRKFHLNIPNSVRVTGRMGIYAKENNSKNNSELFLFELQ